MRAGAVFDRGRLRLRPLAERRHEFGLGGILPLGESAAPEPSPELRAAAARILAARRECRPVILMMGAHVLRAGVQRFLIDLLERGWLTLVAMNGACVVHDFELALVGATQAASVASTSRRTQRMIVPVLERELEGPGPPHRGGA